MKSFPSHTDAVTVLGLGTMGSALAAAFLEKGLRTTVWNRSPEKAVPLQAKGAIPATTIQEAVQTNTLIVVCLLNYNTVYEALIPASDSLKDRIVVNLTTGTPAQARAMSQWMGERGATYIDGGIMAVPPAIGLRESIIFYSGDKESFHSYQPVLDILGTPNYVGEDAGLAPLHDIGLLIGLYGMGGGVLQAIALMRTAGISATSFMDLMVPWLQNMTGILKPMAEQIDKKEYFEHVVSNLHMQSVAYENILIACHEQGIGAHLLAPMHDLLKRAVEAGYGKADIPALVEVIQ